MKVFLSLSVLFILFGCAQTRNTESSAKPGNDGPAMAELGDITVKGDPVTIDTAYVRGHTLTIKMSYSGGCEKHFFDLRGSFLVMKTFPPKRSIKLIHRASGDSCREWISGSAEFDISDLAYEKKSGEEIMLILDGYKHPISYVYP